MPPGQPPSGPPRRDRAALVWWLVGGGVLVAALVAAVVIVVSGSGSGALVPAPVATREPLGLGDDPALDQLARDCFDGAMDACDELFDESRLGSDYEDHGDTCAGRKPAGEWDWCTDVFSDS